MKNYYYILMRGPPPPPVYTLIVGYLIYINTAILTGTCEYTTVLMGRLGV
jgi:hypothetical protein